MASLHVIFNSIILERTDGKTIDLSHFQEVGPICWGYFWFKQNNLYGYMDEEGTVICTPIYISAGNFSKSLYAPVQSETGHGFINRAGREACSLIYDEIWDYNNGYARVRRDDNIYYIDRIGIEHQSLYVERIWNSPVDNNLIY